MEIGGVGRASGAPAKRSESNGLAEIEAQIQQLQDTIKQYKTDLKKASGATKNTLEKNIAQLEKQINNLKSQAEKLKTPQKTEQSEAQEVETNTGKEKQSTQQVAGVDKAMEVASPEAVAQKQLVSQGKDLRLKVDTYTPQEKGEVYDNTYKVEKEGDQFKITFNRPPELALDDLGSEKEDDEMQGRGQATDQKQMFRA